MKGTYVGRWSVSDWSGTYSHLGMPTWRGWCSCPYSARIPLSQKHNRVHLTPLLYNAFIFKVNTAVQLILVAASLAAPVFNYADSIYLQILWCCTAFTTAASAYSYYHYGRKTVQVIKGKWQAPRSSSKERLASSAAAPAKATGLSRSWCSACERSCQTNHVFKTEEMYVQNKLDHGPIQNFQCIFKYK